MTYRNKLLLKRLVLILLCLAALIFVILLIGFTYLGRYVVYTEDGAYFSFHAPEQEPEPEQTVAALSSIELITGAPISANDVIGEAGISLQDHEVLGTLLDYNTLKDGRSLNSIELGANGSNTLILEMRIADEDILSSSAVLKLIDRAHTQETWLVAVLSCLPDSQYALEHPVQALKIDGGALWVGSNGAYYLDPGNPDAIAHLTEIIRSLSEMGFDEVILNDFYLPNSDSLSYDYDGRDGSEIMAEAFNTLYDATMDYCKLGLLVKDPFEGHQLFYVADRIYVCYEDGASVKEFADTHPNQYLVFITSSHDTRFDRYGKVEADSSYTEAAVPEGEVVIEPYVPEEESEESGDEESDEYEDTYSGDEDEQDPQDDDSFE